MKGRSRLAPTGQPTQRKELPGWLEASFERRACTPRSAVEPLTPSFVAVARFASVLLAAALASVGCAESSLFGRQAAITGEPRLYRINPLSGEIFDRDVILQKAGTPLGVVPHEGEIIAITLNSLFLQKLQEKKIGNPHILVYAQVSDDGVSSPEDGITKLIYNGENQPAAASVGFVDPIVYGPTAFKGMPVRMRIVVVELDKANKQRAASVISALGESGAGAAPWSAYCCFSTS